MLFFKLLQSTNFNKLKKVISNLCNGGDLRKVINKRGGRPFNEPDAKKIFKDMLLGMKELVDNNMVHRDLKPENVFVSDNVFKIADFGFC